MAASCESPRLYVVSDIHTDAEENQLWIEQLSPTAYQQDALIVAGDVIAELDGLKTALRALKAKFAVVLFTPGNHDLWVEEEEDSMAKLHSILSLCDEIGVVTRPTRFGGEEPGRGVWLCPLLSFHHQSFDTEPDVQGWAIPTAESTMVDYRACVWPRPLSMLDDSVAAAVDASNDTHAAEALAALAQRPASEPLVTFSPFLPREELLPEKRWLFVPALPKASGSAFLGARVRALKPDVHVT